MIYKYLYSLHEIFSFFNVFKYISFRTMGSIITALAVSLLSAPYIIRKLNQYQIGENIYEHGPKSHLNKKGTPTMGGILIILSLILPTLIWGNIEYSSIWVILVSTLMFGLIGFVDDYYKLRKNFSGLSIKDKLFLQISASFIIVFFLFFFSSEYYTIISIIRVPFFKEIHPDIGYWYIPFGIFVIVATSNAVNLADGLDGLAIGPIIIATGTYMIIAYVSGHYKFATYLNIQYIKGAGELTVFCGSVIGAGLGFLWFNSYPAQIFMGNVGSTALGGMLGTLAIMTKHELILIIAGGIFVVEALSVIIQVSTYKYNKKRIFKMAPLHHHFEESGWEEPKVIVRFWIIAFVLALISLSTLKLR